MEPPFDPDIVRDRISHLPKEAHLAFLLSLAERLLLNYVAFSREERWGDAQALRAAVDLGWTALKGADMDEATITRALTSCEAVTPDTENFKSQFASAALDAAVTAALVLEFIKHSDSEKVIEAASLAHDTVDMFVQEREDWDPQDPDLERKILSHPLMQRELRRQREDLDFLEGMDWRSARVADLTRRWRDSRSNIDVSGNG